MQCVAPDGDGFIRDCLLTPRLGDAHDVKVVVGGVTEQFGQFVGECACYVAVQYPRQIPLTGLFVLVQRVRGSVLVLTLVGNMSTAEVLSTGLLLFRCDRYLQKVTESGSILNE